MSDFLISQEDWSLHKRIYDDVKRHDELVKEAIKNRISDILTDEGIVMNDKNKGIIKIPVESLNEYKIVYSKNKHEQFGMGGEGAKSNIGDTVARDGDGQSIGEIDGNLSGEGAGSAPGEDYYETEVDIEEISNILFEELELPNLEKKQAGVAETTDYEWNDIRKIGITGNIDKKKSLLQAFKRNALDGKSNFYPVKPEDLRYRSYNEITKPDTKAVIIAMMDTSGSMGLWEKYMARSFFFWTQKFLETKYDSVDIVYIAHHTEAKEVTEYEFFHKGEAGGTICSSAYREAIKIIKDRYPPSSHNLYAFHASDGDNLTSDNARCVKLIEKSLSDMVQMFGYIEANQYNRHSTLMSAYKNIRDEKFFYYIMKSREDVFNTMTNFFRKKEENNA